ncbi:MAG: 30S ribosomal protein S19e [Candidatus Bathyarchaeia archaeon]
MTSVFAIPADDFIRRLAVHLMENVDSVTPLSSLSYVKTGTHSDRTPDRKDWWYTRSASVMRKLYTHGPTGISRLRREYGGKTGSFARPEHSRKGGGAILRKALQQLETSGLVKTVPKRGRELTKEARSLMDKLAVEIIAGRT